MIIPQSSESEQLQSTAGPGLPAQGPYFHPHRLCVTRREPEEEDQDGLGQRKVPG